MPLTLPQLERHLFTAADILCGKMDASEVEQPFLDHLASTDWKTVVGSLDRPSLTGRESLAGIWHHEAYP